MQHRGRVGVCLGWGGGGEVVRPVNNPLYSPCANKNANARGKGDAIV